MRLNDFIFHSSSNGVCVRCAASSGIRLVSYFYSLNKNMSCFPSRVGNLFFSPRGDIKKQRC